MSSTKRATNEISAEKRVDALSTPTDLTSKNTAIVAKELNKLVADAFALYLKTKNFHWHASGPHFRDYHLMFDEQADQIFASIDPLAERVRKLGQRTLLGVANVVELMSIADTSPNPTRRAGSRRNCPRSSVCRPAVATDARAYPA